MADCSFGVILLRLSEEMYIQKAEITNIKSIEHFEIEFPNPAGWHVLIGDNGSGKSTIVRSMALALVENEFYGFRANWGEWLNKQSKEGKIKLKLFRDESFDKLIKIKTGLRSEIVKGNQIFFLNVDFLRKETGVLYISSGEDNLEKPDGFFSSAFGPYRRFEGGNEEWESVFNNPSYTKLASHLSIFDESVALTEPVKWLKDLNYKTLEKNEESKHTFDHLKELINSEDFLPHNSKLENISSNGVFFKDANGITVSVNQLSDGYRSILSLTFELIRQLILSFGTEKVFNNIEKGEMFINLPGVVLIDEIDAHLHPTWQTRIGQWFLKYFPNLQFIVTTHSPLVCRACEKGSIWRLAAPGSDEKSGEVTGIDRERLIYGNVLDAYGTGVFGENTSISQDSNDLLNRLSELNVKSMMGLIDDKESEELQELRAKFPTENKIVSNLEKPSDTNPDLEKMIESLQSLLKPTGKKLKQKKPKDRNGKTKERGIRNSTSKNTAK